MCSFIYFHLHHRMKTEISAGGVIVRNKGSYWEILLMKDMNGSWTFPKGIIEPSEDPKSAAAREISEEVGITSLTFVARLSHVEYWYRKNGLIHKTVKYFVFSVNGNPPIQIQKEEGITDAQWFSFKKAMEIVGYPKTNIKLIEETKKCLTKRQ